MFTVDDPDLSWAVTKAVVIVVSGFGSLLFLAWAAAKKTFLK
jgi:hypothetical protein